MAVIWKWVLREQEQIIEVPLGTTLLSTGWDPKSGVCVWGRVPDPNTVRTEKRRIIVIGTGQEYPNILAKFLGTVIMFDSGLVWHIYEGA